MTKGAARLEYHNKACRPEVNNYHLKQYSLQF